MNTPAWTPKSQSEMARVDQSVAKLIIRCFIANYDLIKIAVGLKISGFYLFSGFPVATCAGGVFVNRSLKVGLVEIWPKDFA